MNNCRAGLYGFTPTTTWLRETGMASPPSLVMLGLTLPDSRILVGIAGIGLTLTNITIILPYLRQPIPDSIRVGEGAPAHEQSTQEETGLSSHAVDVTQPVDLKMESPALAPASPYDEEHQNAFLPCSASAESVRSVVPEPLECLGAGSEVAPVGKTEDITSEIHRSPDVDSSEKLVGFNRLLVREGRSPLQIPLPVPDATEVAFFDCTGTSSSIRDLDLGEGSAACEQHTDPEEDYTIQDDGLIAIKGFEQNDHSIVADLSNTSDYAELGEDLIDVELLIANENVSTTTMEITIQDWNHSVIGDTTFHLPDSSAACEGTLQSALVGHSVVTEKEVEKRRPESLDFIPQSVIRRYPSASTVSAGRCSGHGSLSSGHGHRPIPVLPHTLVNSPAMLPSGPNPLDSYTAPELPRIGFLPGVQPNNKLTGGRPLVLEIVPAQYSLVQGLASLEPPTVHELATLKKYPTHKRRLGVLTRAALRNRRSAARRCRSNGIDGGSASDSDSDSDSDSQCSGASSTDESMLPHMLGADLIAAIDANSESELNLAGPGRTIRTPLGTYGDILVSADSVADVSMIMQVSSIGNASDGDVKAPVTLRSLTHEDIQQWAFGVVQKCVRQVCRGHATAEPLSPSQASDVCAERPSGSGTSQCPLSGLHCKLGASAHVPASRTKELPVPLPPTYILPTRKPLTIRNPRDIPEFVPRQRHASVTTGRVEGHSRPSTRPAIEVTRDAATEVIARLESQAGFNARQWFVGRDRTRSVSTARGLQSALRCA